jgi:hypothetical protein
MFRKITLALAAATALGAAALVPSVASAHGHGHGHGHGHWGHFGHHWRGGFGFYAPIVYGGTSCYIVRRVVETPYGPRVRRVEVCG